jgi:hypothetical protein
MYKNFLYPLPLASAQKTLEILHLSIAVGFSQLKKIKKRKSGL